MPLICSQGYLGSQDPLAVVDKIILPGVVVFDSWSVGVLGAKPMSALNSQSLTFATHFVVITQECRCK